jgi:thioesterase domain-containing protein/acyl carrier protein
MHTMPMFHGHGLKSGLLVPLLGESGVIFAPFVDVALFFDHVISMEATWFSAGYTIHHAIYDRLDRFQDLARRARLRFIVSGAGQLERKVAEALEAAFDAPMLDRYSMSETCALACEPLPPGMRKRGTVGTPILNEIRVVDAQGASMPFGRDGEIVARGPSVFDGYLDEPELNAQSFVDGWFRTGDVGHLDDDGYLTITGRIKEMINRGGEKIAPSEIERAIATHPAVAAVCVVGVPHPTLGEDVAAAIVPAQGVLADERTIVAHAQTHLAPFKVPRRIVFTAEIPRSASGKPDRRALAAMIAAQPIPALGDVSERSSGDASLEDAIAALWQDLLKIEYVRRDVDFLAAGGDSLKVAEMVVALKDRFGVRASVKQVVDDGATVMALARLVAQLRRECGLRERKLPDGIVALKPEGRRAALFALPGSDGGAGSYVHFCRLLSSEQPLYAIESRGLDGRARPLTRMEDIAADNIVRMRAVQPEGPYHLIGACYGGRVAYEMARQLEAAGASVAFLAMLDPSPPYSDSHGRPHGAAASLAGTHRWSRPLRFARDRVALYARQLRRLDRAGRFAFIRSKLKTLADILTTRDVFRGDSSELHRIAVYEANVAAGRRYVAGPYYGSVTLVFTEGRKIVGPRNYRLDWLELLPQSGVPRMVPGRDTGDMLVPPNVATLVVRLEQWLGEAQANEPA